MNIWTTYSELNNQKIVASVENVVYQEDSDLLSLISQWFDDCKKLPYVNNENVNTAKFLKAIKDITGLTVRVEVTENLKYGLIAVKTPYYDINTVMKSKDKPAEAQAVKLLAAMKMEALEVVVDYKKAKVSGRLSGIPNLILIDRILFKNTLMSNQESASLVIHELGHAFNNYAYLGTVYRDNFILNEAIERMKGVTIDKKVTIVKTMASKLNIESKGIEAFVSSVNDVEMKDLQIYTLAETRQKWIDLTGYDFYTERACEQLADHFAIQHRAGRHLATSLDKIEHITSPGYKRGRGRHMLIETAKAIALTAPFGLPLAAVLLCSSKGSEIYDRPIQRIETIRQILRSNLKDPSLDPKSDKVKEIMNDLKFIEGIIGSAKDHMTYVDFMYSKLFPSGRKRFNNEQTQKAIENLVSNPLFETAMKFKQLGS